ncbi:hypothetical protein COV53_01510 [Candidatus Gottesmanbacteria bacterium CG11_big_fil_rev_8_21_14_0_20_37_11]|uniref:UPF0758 domain-containing protein n=3 Tax=Candidatus Gottesmaniibacteriota TaxID=1752720 RepID=A0A2M7RPX1_9BACT|nr:MAG: hypothetical protein AUJ73_01130 [Candidatus Gottesmanbacteria bacterium CG1_02_37_22]PIP32980.1 MAG: hypothetical protein COX23_01815 [Candidatus Gottesmanbacteria bacterium CG23_combo_of_CG06-09_8_20_14_all_37_19]PIR08729.1 MAG: hypothetical protein COV53_01510 [Candidatus Gottesmanbacteria bacterium CG11_big_fil_rev_8_21_14_0_20_37_11]PIZ02373.1 MAG: hypothetical protein COY59_05150 [Candidatus Gottesmanbacteria bacterium CG_4_10_14_0_8_um_filter_37_24]
MSSRKETPKITKTKDGKLVSWRHPGGKLLRVGPDSLTDSELIAILIGSGVPGKSAESIANELLSRFQSFRGLANQQLEKFKEIKGLKTVKVVRIAAAFEIAKRIVNQVLKEREK